MKRSAQSATRLFPAMLIALVLAGLGSVHARAQSVESDAITEKLSIKVRLRLGKTTMDKVAATLSEQTGIKIEPSDYLRDREMVAQMDGVSARGVLNALSELNDWRWKETPEHTISITRHVLRLSPVPAAVPRLIQSAIPRDVRTFLGIPTPSENISFYSNPLLPDGAGMRNDPQGRVLRLLGDTLGDLLTRMQSNQPKQETVPFTKLTEPQRRDVVAQLAFGELQRLDERLLSEFLPFVYDPGSARLHLTPNDFRVGFKLTPDSWAGFVAELRPPTAP